MLVARVRHLTRAPIQEALIDIQFAPVLDADIAGIAAEFSPGGGETSFDVWQGMFEVQVTPTDGPQPVVKKTGSVGKRIDLTEDHQVLQLRSNGFTFSQLAPYQTWEAMRDAAVPLWERYVDRIAPTAISRIAIRYINSITLPVPLADFGKYLIWAPCAPDEVGEGVAGFLTRVVIPKGDDVGIITQSLDGPAKSGQGVKMILDIDISHMCELAPYDLESLIDVLERLRKFKNSAFFSYLTEDALEMFE
jgi:uncharacterized protein (TIGR04255 family)